ncbi:tetratricopeptide repeat protein [Acetobacter persici]|nr:tetratricopeptide repeat protein [Acetobacter persici]
MTEALRLYRSELELNPDDALILSNYGAALSETNDFQGSLTALKRAVSLAPEMADAWCNLGNTLTHLQDYRGAVQAYQQSVKLHGNHPLAISNLAFAIDQLGENPALARKLHEMAVRLDPENEQTRTNNALSLLREGNYLEGFREYEWRWTTYRKRLGLTVPTWQGESMSGGTLFVTTEGGYGDMIQFCRFLPQAEIVSAGNVVLTARAELLSLLRHSFPAFTIIEEKGDIEPAHGKKPGMGQSLAQVSVMSLPFALGITIDSIPMAGGYLTPPPMSQQNGRSSRSRLYLKNSGMKRREDSKNHCISAWCGPEARIARSGKQNWPTDGAQRISRHSLSLLNTFLIQYFTVSKSGIKPSRRSPRLPRCD